MRFKSTFLFLCCSFILAFSLQPAFAQDKKSLPREQDGLVIYMATYNYLPYIELCAPDLLPIGENSNIQNNLSALENYILNMQSSRDQSVPRQHHLQKLKRVRAELNEKGSEKLKEEGCDSEVALNYKEQLMDFNSLSEAELIYSIWQSPQDAE